MTNKQSTTPTSRKTPIFSGRLKGFHLIALSEQLNSPTRLETAYILGVPLVTWYEYGKGRKAIKLKKVIRKVTSLDSPFLPALPFSLKTAFLTDDANSVKPISRPSLCLLLRFGFTFPSRLQRTIYPEAGPLFEKLKQLNPKATYKVFSELLARESSAGHRWLKKGNSFDGTTRRLALHFNQYLTEGRLDEWERMIDYERKMRGAEDSRSMALKDPGTPLDAEYVATVPPEERLLVVGDVSYLQNFCDLSSTDSIYHLGLSQKLWSELGNSNPLLPIRDPVLSVLLRLYLNYPEDLDSVRLPTVTIDDVFSALKDPRYGLKDRFQADEIALMLGFSPSIAQRWGYKSSTMRNYTPMQLRLLSHFHQEITAGRFDDWYRLVMVEAESRGIKNLWETGWDD